jgi:hypothetical protein
MITSLLTTVVAILAGLVLGEIACKIILGKDR